MKRTLAITTWTLVILTTTALTALPASATVAVDGITNSCNYVGCTDTVTVTAHSTTGTGNSLFGASSTTNATLIGGSFTPIANLYNCLADGSTYGYTLCNLGGISGSLTTFTYSFQITILPAAQPNGVTASLYDYSTTTTTFELTTDPANAPTECDATDCSTETSSLAAPIIELGTSALGTGLIIGCIAAFIRQTIGRH